jgi:transcriptional regulator with XRE-family HTH domain
MEERTIRTKLKARIIEKNISRKVLADKLHIKPGTLTKKLNGHIPFSNYEVVILKNELDIKDKEITAYFF